MKKIVHISKYYYPFSGGTEQIARDCVLALKGLYSQKVIAFNDGKEDKVGIVDGIEVIKCGCFTKIAAQSLSISYGKQLHRVMKEFDPDIVVFHYPNPFVAALLLREMKNTKAKLVVYWHLDISKLHRRKQMASVGKRQVCCCTELHQCGTNDYHTRYRKTRSRNSGRKQG